MPGRPLVVVAAALAGAVVLAACGGDDSPSGDAERFCGEAIAQRDAIVAPPLSTEAELAATLDFYRLMGSLAPVAIADEWGVLVETIETASTVVPDDPESMQRVAMQAYASERSADAVARWLSENCGLTLPITTIVDHRQVPAVTPTTAPSADGSTPSTTAGG